MSAISATKPTILIVGTGLIGTSLGLALSRHGYRVVGLSRSEASRRTAIKRGAIERVADASDLLSTDIVVLCTPIDRMSSVLKKILPGLKKGAIITDVGSVKQSVVSAMQPLLHSFPSKKFTFVGAHPMAGSHETGPKAARENLFKNATCVLLSNAPKPALKTVRTMWESAGARIHLLSAEEHDRMVAVISHLPHLMAFALVRIFLEQPQFRKYQSLIAGSFRDVTRVAAADPVQWATIFKLNAHALRQASKQLIREMNRLEFNFQQPSTGRDLSQAQRFRKKLFHGS